MTIHTELLCSLFSLLYICNINEDFMLILRFYFWEACWCVNMCLHTLTPVMTADELRDTSNSEKRSRKKDLMTKSCVPVAPKVRMLKLWTSLRVRPHVH